MARLLSERIHDKIKPDMSPNFFKITRKSRLIETLKDKADDPFVIKEGKFKDSRLKDPAYYSDWTEDSFLSDSGEKAVISRSFNPTKLKYFVWLVVLALAILVIRALWLQVFKNDYYYGLSEGNRLRSETIEAKRGIIYDRNFQPLVRNEANQVLYLVPVDLPKDELARDGLVREISRILAGETAAATTTALVDKTGAPISLVTDNAVFYQIKEALAKIKIGSLESYHPLFVADNLDYDQAMLVALNLPDWPGVFLTDKIRREYLGPSVASSSPPVLAESSLAHVLGYTGKINDQELAALGGIYSPLDYVGKTGLEYSWEKELRGVPGQKNIEVDALGRQKTVVNEVPATDGDNLLLSLDAKLQDKAEEVTRAYIQKMNLKRASVVIMNPNNGEIMALVSLPGYNNNSFAKGISQADYAKLAADPNQPLFNRAVSGNFPSGSVIKPVFAAGALAAKIITETTSVLSTGGLHVGQWFFPDWKAGGHGITNVRKALAESVNTFFYYIGGGYGDFKGLDVAGLAKYARLFGLGAKTGIDLPNEGNGFVPTAAWKEQTKKEKWYIGDTYHFAIGQGDVLVTPLQVANYTAAIANNGTLYVPHLVTKVLGKDNQILKTIVSQTIRTDLVDPSYLQIVREGLRQTITTGSARSLSVLPVAVAGKTGTAQWSTTRGPHAWFAGFAPYDHPQLVIVVMVEEGVEGSTIAAPIARDILNWYFSPSGGGATATSSPSLPSAPAPSEVRAPAAK